MIRTAIETLFDDEPILTREGKLRPLFAWYRDEPAPRSQAYTPPLTDEELAVIQSPLQHALYLLTKVAYKEQA